MSRLQDIDGEDARGLNGLTIWAVLGLVDHDLRLLHLLDHRLLLHCCQHATWLLHARHVHWRHACGITLAVHEHLLLGGLVVLTRSCALVIISLMLAAVAVDNGGLSVHLRVAHLSGHSNLLYHPTIHRLGLWWIRWHGHLLGVHVLLLVLGLVLIHTLAHLAALCLRVGLA